MFKSTWHVTGGRKRTQGHRWTADVNDLVQAYAVLHPCFYIEKLEELIRDQFPSLTKVSTSTISRALMHDLGLTRKVLEKRAREAADFKLRAYYGRVQPYYSYPDHLLFVDETSKDGSNVLRKYAWSKRNTKAIVELQFARGERVSALAAFTTSGFLAWEYTDVNL
ncbi:hypothetical protein AaE_009195 [Aphanomyces astaci]|uniref:Tc1-like transposase DDE domain-containing protein n=1 Tax=Aphanomyces astaci TaxID=112090 RepID=A0A6A4ZT17_APHAT|nr:hypothetical protein AaE_009195 [Aphanomyces astaci]